MQGAWRGHGHWGWCWGPPRPAATAGTPAVTAPFADDFERADLGADWNATSPAYRIKGGQLSGLERPQPPGLAAPRLPANAVIEFDVWSKSPAGDFKVEI